MKNVVIAAAVIVLFIIIAGLIALKVVLPPSNTTTVPNSVELPIAPPQTNSSITLGPADTVKTCYAWYVKAFASDLRRTSSEEYKKGVLACFTPEFAAQWGAIAASTDSDPVLIATDYGKSWMTSQDARILSQNDTQSTVALTLGTASETYALTVNLTKTPSGWRISSASRPN